MNGLFEVKDRHHEQSLINLTRLCNDLTAKRFGWVLLEVCNA